jgi:ribosomal protein L34E
MTELIGEIALNNGRMIHSLRRSHAGQAAGRCRRLYHEKSSRPAQGVCPNCGGSLCGLGDMRPVNHGIAVLSVNHIAKALPWIIKDVRNCLD